MSLKNKIKFSIIVVCLNPGDKLIKTLESINSQDYDNYEVIVKDGFSTDKSVDSIIPNEKTKIYVEKDKGIYDAMNQAITHASGDFVLFMNCGDVFYAEDVLTKTEEFIIKNQGLESFNPAIDKVRFTKSIYYGNTYSMKTNSLITSPPVIDGFACYRNIPCHQSCFYEMSLCRQKKYDQTYRIRADYDHFLWCFYEAKAQIVNMNITVASYEGGGYSESKDNKKKDKQEHKEICQKYMSAEDIAKYRGVMALTLSPLRSALAESKTFSGVYNNAKKVVYDLKNKEND